MIDIVIECGGIEYAIEKMNEFITESIRYSFINFPDNPDRKGLEDLVNFVTDRKY